MLYGLQFYAFDGTPEAIKRPDRFIALTDGLDTATLLGRFNVLRCIFNIARVLHSIRDILPTEVYPLGMVVTMGDSTITYNFDCVEKRVPVAKLPYCGDPAIRLRFLKLMYEHAKTHPCLVTFSDEPKFNRTKTHYYVRFTTMGIHELPCNEMNVRGLAKNMISALVCLHQGGYLHRDVRLANIVYDRENNHYVLIDFEHGGYDRRRGDNQDFVVPDDPPLKDWDDKTLDNGVYTSSSDLYQLGKLLQKFGTLVISDQGKIFIQELIEKRMGGNQALENGWIVDV
jgi:serine/threonine protein kinase